MIDSLGLLFPKLAEPLNLSKGYILRFCLQQIAEALDGESVAPELRTQATYCIEGENGFAVLSDKDTIIAPLSANNRILCAEKMSDQNNPKLIREHGHSILTIIAIEEHSCVLVGDEEGRLVQYQLGDSSWKDFFEYGNLGIGWVNASAQLGDLVVLGGTYWHFSVIDVAKKSRVRNNFTNAIRWIDSLQMCKVGSSMILSICGELGNFSGSCPDLINLTTLISDDNPSEM